MMLRLASYVLATVLTSLTTLLVTNWAFGSLAHLLP